MHLLGTLYDFLGKRVEDGKMEPAVGTSDKMASAATRSLALYIATSYIANAISKCEVKVFRGGKAVKDELYWALNVSPNPSQNASEFWNKAVSKCLYEGSSLMVQPDPNKLEFYIADSFSRDPRPLRAPVYSGVSVDGATLTRELAASEACQFKLEDRYAARCVRLLYEDISALIAASDGAFKKARGDRFTWRTDGRARGGEADVKGDAASVAELLKPFVTGANGVLPIKDGQQLERVKSDPCEGKEPLEMRRSIFDFTAQALKIPQSMMYGNMTNSVDIANQFVTFAVDPHATMISDETTRSFFDFREWDGGKNYIKVDTSRIGHIDVFQMADKVEKLFSSGIYSMDDIREAVGDEPLNTDFSRAHWVSKNYALIQEVLASLADETGEGGENNG